jgi:hypothetical protein
VTSAAVEENFSNCRGINKIVDFADPRCRTPNRETVAGLAPASLWVSKMNLFYECNEIIS